MDARDSARREATSTLAAFGDDPAQLSGGIERYAAAMGDAATLREAWRALGSPTMALGGNAQVCVHPLIKEIREAEAHAAKLAKAIGLTPDGRRSAAGHPKGQSPSADRGARLKRAA